MKRYKHSAVLGKFMPLHLGHEHLIDTAIQHSEKVTVIVCSLPTEPIDGELRYQWMVNRYRAEMAAGSVDVVHLDDAWVPQSPADCRLGKVFYGVWAGIIGALCEEQPDAFFSSEEYGYPVAEALGCEHYLVDIHRKTFPVSGTACRANPMANWTFMNPDVRRYFCRKILIIGPESTGKSTLTKKLAEHYANTGYLTANVQEFAREWIDEKIQGDMGRLKFDHITLFGKSQVALVEQAEMNEGVQLIFSDTDAIVSCIFQEIYYGKVDPELLEASRNEKWDLVLFTQPDVPWVDDGQRDLGHRREEVNHMFERALKLRDIAYVEVHGNWSERFQIAVHAVDALLDCRMPDFDNKSSDAHQTNAR